MTMMMSLNFPFQQNQLESIQNRQRTNSTTILYKCFVSIYQIQWNEILNVFFPYFDHTESNSNFNYSIPWNNRNSERSESS